MKSPLKKIGALLLLVIAALFCSLTVATAFAETGDDTEAEEAATRHVRLAILSDIHYVSDVPAEGTQARANFDKAENTENRMMMEVDKILGQALLDAQAKDPDAVLVCGDIASNGELDNQQGLAAKLSAAKAAMGDVGFYVVNGNHDINNSYGAKFSGNAVQNATRTQVADFKETYQDLGYGGSDIRFYDATPSAAVQNYGALSYATEIAEGITLIALDTAQYGNDASARFDDAQLVAGEVSDGLLAWAAEEASTAKAKGNLVLVMCHHSLIPHQGIVNEGSSLFFSEYLVPNWEHVAGTLADAGVSVILTGHSHANDISRYTTEAGNTIYDVQTAALCAYPCAWRTLDITITEQNGHADYDFAIQTNFIEQVAGLDLSYGGKTYSSLQGYSYDKTGLPGDGLENLASYLLNEFLYSVKTYDTEYGTGLQGFIREQMELAGDDATVGDVLTASIKEMLEGVEYQELDFEYLSYPIHLTMAFKESDSTSVSYDITLSALGSNETGTLVVDLAGFPSAFNTMVDKLNTMAAGEEQDWATNYTRTAFHQELMKLLKNSILPTLYQPLSEDDEFSTPHHIAKDALQAFARGDEVSFVPDEYGDMSIEELQSKRVGWNELIVGEAFANSLTSSLAPEVSKLTSDETYPQLYSVLNTPLASNNQAFLRCEDASGLILSYIIKPLLATIKTPADVLKQLDSFGATESLLSVIPLGSLTPIVGDIQASMTTDTNVTSDSELAFHTVRFDPQGGETSRESALTQENGKLGIELPTATWDDTGFLGWFTAPRDGEQVTADTDFSEIAVVYAHWDKSDMGVFRICGKTRYETSLMVADELKEQLGVEKFDAVILAAGDNFPDALAGSYLSCLLDAPILLVGKSNTADLQAYIRENLEEGGTIYMLGGAPVVPDSAVKGLDGYGKKRLYGADRYATNLKILEEAATFTTDNEIVVCTGTGFADSLSAAALGKPILLVGSKLTNAQKEYLASLGEGCTFTIIGGTGAVSDSIASALGDYGAVDRIGGATRYETSVGVAEKYFDAPEAGVLAYGQNFPDGLCGGALAFAKNAPLILAADGSTQAAEAYAAEAGMISGYVLGGPTLIGDSAVVAIFDLDGPEDIILK